MIEYYPSLLILFNFTNFIDFFSKLGNYIDITSHEMKEIMTFLCVKLS